MKAVRNQAPVIIIALLLAFAIARPVAAQQVSFGPITLGSPGDPPRVALGAGAFDFTPSEHPDSRTAAELRGEYRFGDTLWIFAPFIGASGTSNGAVYTYFGFGFDINFGPDWVLTPTGAAGYFYKGGGTNLGSFWEFRTGAELDYRLPNQDRIGIAINHTSNAGLTQRNPGEQSAVLVYTVPIP